MHYIAQGIGNGFRIGFNLSDPLQSAKQNMKSSVAHPEVVSFYITDEVQVRRMLGPFTPEEAKVTSWHAWGDT